MTFIGAFSSHWSLLKRLSLFGETHVLLAKRASGLLGAFGGRNTPRARAAGQDGGKRELGEERVFRFG